MAALAERLDDALHRVELDHAEIARVLGTNARTVSRWIRNQSKPRPKSRERLLELLAVVDRLGLVLRPEPAHDWLFAPNPELGHRKPAELVQEGRYPEVLAAIDALGEGVFV